MPMMVRRAVAPAPSARHDERVDGIHDLGGMDGFGPVDWRAEEPVFSQDWERRARGLVYAVVLHVENPTTSLFRHAIERIDPADYLASTYYEHWLAAAASLAVEAGLVGLGELEERSGGRFPVARPVRPNTQVEGPVPPTGRFGVGDRVRVRDFHPRGHTRCPRYVRGRSGVVVRADTAASVPDVEAHSADRRAEAVYSVGFDAYELWRDAQPGVRVHVDVWDSYLEAAR